MIYRVKFLLAWSTLLIYLSLSTLLALEVMTPQKRKTKAILLWWMVSLTCLISPLSIVHISEQGRYDIYTIRLKAIDQAPLIYLKELQFSISESRPKANEFGTLILFLLFLSFLFSSDTHLDRLPVRPRQECSYCYILSCAGLLL